MTYFYSAKNLQGENVSGSMEAKDKVGVARALRGQGLVPIHIEAKEASHGEADGGEKGAIKQITTLNIKGVFDALRGVALAEKMMFSRHLSVMMSAGVPVTRGLEVLSKQTTNAKFRSAILQIAEDLRGGKQLADSLARFPGIFDTLYVSLVRSGDAAGNLPEVLALLADHQRKEHELKSRVKGALMYPLVIVIAMGGVGALMMTFVVPKLAAIFEELNVPLPLLTQLIIGVSKAIRNYWIFSIILLPALFFLLKKLMATTYGRSFLSWLFLHAPILRPITQKVNSALFARTLSSLIEGGVPILDGLLITRDTVGNFYYRRSMEKIYEEVKGGGSLFEALQRFEGIFPGLIVQMVRVGEETGSLGDMLKRTAEFYEEEVNNTTRNLSSIIEPILMIVIGVVVGVFAISMIQPMYSVTNQL